MKHKSIQKLIISSLLTALMVVLSRFVSIPVTDSLRISLECIPVILSGLWLGPIYGAIVGGLGDLIGAILFPFGPYFFPLTIGPMILGFVCGGLSSLYQKENKPVRYVWIILTIVFAELLNSFLYGTLALTWYYSIILGKDVSFWILFVPRAPAKAITMCIDIVLTLLLEKVLYKNTIEKMHLRT